MGVLSSVAERLRRQDRSADTFSYRCAGCGERFELAKDRMVVARCPACDSTNVRTADADD